jgi:hypothetical protein
MKTIQELADLVVVRDHLFTLLSGTRNSVKKGEIGQISFLVQKLDTEFIKDALELFTANALETLQGEDVDIAKRVAEAKAKMALYKESRSAGTAQPLAEARVSMTEKVTDVTQTAVEEQKPVEEVKQPTRRVIKKAIKNDAGTV